MMEREIKVNVINGELSEEEKNAYIAYEKDKHPTRTIESMDIKVDGDYVDITVNFKPEPPFHRIRRITGYLSSDYRHFNNAKQAEVKDRVKHDV